MKWVIIIAILVISALVITRIAPNTSSIMGVVGTDCPAWRSNYVTTVNYYSSANWIATDCNNDGTYEAYGNNGFMSAIDIIGYTVTKTDTTPEGFMYKCAVSGGRNELYVYDPSRTTCSIPPCVTVHEKDYGAASSADKSCVGVCTPNWQCTVWGTCTSGTQTRVCTDSNSCGVLTNKPAESQTCTVGTQYVCDTNSDGKIGDTEVLPVLGKWKSGG